MEVYNTLRIGKMMCNYEKKQRMKDVEWYYDSCIQ